MLCFQDPPFICSDALHGRKKKRKKERKNEREKERKWKTYTSFIRALKKKNHVIYTKKYKYAEI